LVRGEKGKGKLRKDEKKKLHIKKKSQIVFKIAKNVISPSPKYRDYGVKLQNWYKGNTSKAP
jgi:hypothetical protein